MNQAIKKQWVNALRSGQYTQASGNLRSNLGHCCLGVLCDLYAKEMGKEWECHQTADKNSFPHYSFQNETSFLPVSVIEWAGLSRPSPTVKISEAWEELAYLNDQPVSFEEIANLIEEQL